VISRVIEIRTTQPGQLDPSGAAVPSDRRKRATEVRLSLTGIDRADPVKGPLASIGKQNPPIGPRPEQLAVTVKLKGRAVSRRRFPRDQNFGAVDRHVRTISNC